MEKYIFDGEGDDALMVVQRVKKCEMAFFYDRTPAAFRRELDSLCIISNGKNHYNCTEVSKIFSQLGPITRACVQKAEQRITDYYKNLRNKYLEKKWKNSNL